MKKILTNTFFTAILSGVIVLLLTMAVTYRITYAAQDDQGEDPHAAVSDNDCKECHLNITEEWSTSPHANAYSDPYFQERWAGLGNPSECLVCHTTNFQATTNTFSAEGVSCEECHGPVLENHPPEAVPIQSDAEYCGKCHTTTLSEWRLTGHSTSGVGCTDCHNPHDQQALFEVDDALCINCHQEDMEAYLEDTHVQKNIGCVDCHALVIPPDPIPEDGIVPTGHTFTITPATCVACHTDSLHAGFSLPGYESGATQTVTETETITQTITIHGQEYPIAGQILETGISTEQRIQALEASLANRQMTTLIQGGVIGLVLGGTTAWFVSQNVRRSFVESKTYTNEDALHTEHGYDQDQAAKE